MKLYIYSILVFLLSLNFIGCKKANPNKNSTEIILKHQLTILKSDSIFAFLINENDFPFAGQVSEIDLSENELIIVDSLLLTAINEYNKEMKSKIENLKKTMPNLDENYLILHSSLYNYQIVVVKNSIGEKLIWINALCESYDNWRKDIAIIFDGGNCFFNLKINLTKKMYFEFSVNGVA